MSSFCSLETIRDENSGSVTVLGSLALDSVPGAASAVSSFLRDFGLDPSTGVFDVAGIPVTVSFGDSGAGSVEAVASSGTLSFSEADLRSAVRYVLEKALEIFRIHKAVRASEEAL